MELIYLPILFLLCHFVGDYLLQSDWQALNKNTKTLNCLVHVCIYTSVFLLMTFSWKALLFIGVTHFIIDRFPIIVKRFIWLRNHLNPTLLYPSFDYCSTTGYYDDSPYNKANTKKLDPHLKAIWKHNFGEPRLFIVTVWLYIVHDNVLHLICNLIALTLLTK